MEILSSKTLTWTPEGRLYRAKLSGNRQVVALEYDANGLRTSKTYGGVLHEYTYDDGRLITEKINGYSMVFLYDESNNVDCIWYNGDKYYLIRNTFGDVVQLRDASNQVVAYYKYNAFGYLLSVTDAAGNEITDTSHIAHLNPIRYRGYYYDAELKMYYLYSRYYNPEMGRFISADVLVGTSLAGTNLFAYCYNNPVNFIDPYGYCGYMNPCGCTYEQELGCDCTTFLCDYEKNPVPDPLEKEEDDNDSPFDNNAYGKYNRVQYVSGGGGGSKSSATPAVAAAAPAVEVSPAVAKFQSAAEAVAILRPHQLSLIMFPIFLMNFITKMLLYWGLQIVQLCIINIMISQRNLKNQQFIMTLQDDNAYELIGQITDIRIMEILMCILGSIIPFIRMGKQKGWIKMNTDSLKDIQGKKIRISELLVNYDEYEQLKLLIKASTERKKFILSFYNVSQLVVQDFSSPTEIEGFEIVSNKHRGWEQDVQYQIRDFENGQLHFYCECFEFEYIS